MFAAGVGLCSDCLLAGSFPPRVFRSIFQNNKIPKTFQNHPMQKCIQNVSKISPCTKHAKHSCTTMIVRHDRKTRANEDYKAQSQSTVATRNRSTQLQNNNGKKAIEKRQMLTEGAHF